MVAVIRRAIRRARASWRITVLTVLTLAAIGLAAGVYFVQFRPDQQTEVAAEAAKTAAEDGTVAILSYSPDTLDRDVTNAKRHLTGDFLKYYTNFTQQIMTSAARDRQVETEATVSRAAVSAMHPDSAEVLVFVNKQSSSKDTTAQLTTATVQVTLKNVDGSWLIDQFEPL